MTYYLNPEEDSYRRLGTAKAPCYVCWGKENRSQLVRIPASKDGLRLELRSPDTMANPYLAYALVIHAALDGIKKCMAPPPATDEDLFNAPESVTSRLVRLPWTLDEARAKADSEFVRKALGA
jgi:glutamine synthetase